MESSKINELKKQLVENGYVVIPGLIEKEDIKKCKTSIEEYFENENNPFICGNGGMSQSNSFGYISGIRFLLGQEKILKLFSQIAGRELVYLNHCDAHQDRLGGWHKDSTGYVKHQWEERDGDESFGVYKIAIYLQDHSNDTNGLSIRDGSHKFDDYTTGKRIDIHSKEGDVIFFDQRLSHCGQEYKFLDKVINRLMKRHQKSRTKISRKLRKILGVKSKISIFYGVGVDNEFSKEFTSNIIKRQNIQNKVDQYVIHTEVEKYLADSNTRIIEYKSN